jgi:hypothetical protein
MLRVFSSTLLLPLLVAESSLFAQTAGSSIGGRVVDPSGLPVLGAAVIVTEESTKTTAKTMTGDSGDFVVSYLKPGLYTIRFLSQGFKEHVETGIELQVDQSRRVNPVLEIGPSTEVIQVSASAAQVDYISPEIGYVVEADQLINLPQLASA